MSKITFETIDGIRHETTASLKRQIAEITGFQLKKIVPLEASSSYCEIIGGVVFDNCNFSVNGKGFYINLGSCDWFRDPNYDM